jgi:hypothetical protein
MIKNGLLAKRGKQMKTIPLIVIYFFAQAKLIGGIASMGWKG